MRRTRLITLVAALFMALGLIGVSPSVPFVGSDNVAAAASCPSLNTLDRLYGIQINVDKGSANNGVLYNGKRQRAGVVISPTGDQIRSLRSKGWVVQGQGRVRSAWAPARCGQLATGGWTPSVTRQRTCLSVAQLDTRFGIDENALGTDFGLIRKKSGTIIGAVVHLTKANKATLRKKDWTYNGASSTVKSIFAPSWCWSLKKGGWKPDSRCYTISELDAKFGVVTSAGNNGRLTDNGKLAGAVIRVTADQKSELRRQNWTLQGEDPNIQSAWAPTPCRPLRES